MKVIKSGILLFFISMIVLSVSGCAPEIGSEAWCKQLAEKDKGDWSANEVADYAKHCLFK